MKRIISTLLFSALLITSFGFSQEEKSVGGALGAVTIDGKIYNQIALRPVVPIWKFGVALDLVFYIDEDGNLHEDEWDFSDGPAIARTLIDKIYYIRFGQPNDPLYVKVGSLDYVDLGYGILVNGYTNTTEYPSVRKVGLDLSVKTKLYNIEGFVDDFKTNAGLFGARVSSPVLLGIPVGASMVVDRNQYLGLKDRDGDGLPDLVDDFPRDKKWKIDTDGDGLADIDPREFDVDGDGLVDVNDTTAIHQFWDDLGNTVGTDFSGMDFYDSLPDPYQDRRDPLIDVNKDSDPIAALAFDVGYPVISEGPFSLSIYSQMAKMIGKTIDPKTGDEVSLGMGLIPLGVSSGFGPVKLAIEYRMIPGSGRFDFNYWNRTYDLERSVLSVAGNTTILRTKEQSLGRFGPQNGFFANLTVRAGQLLSVGARYQNLKGDIWSDGDNDFITKLNQSLLGQVKLTKSISKLKHAVLFYEQRNVPNPFKFELTEGTIMGYKLGLELGSGMVLNYVVQRSFRDLDGDGKISGNSEAINTTSIETSFAF